MPVQVPRSAAEGVFKAATIYDPTPYGTGTVDENEMNSTIRMNPVPFDYSRLCEPGAKRIPIGCGSTLDAAEAADPESWNYNVPYSNDKGYVQYGSVTTGSVKTTRYIYSSTHHEGPN